MFKNGGKGIGLRWSRPRLNYTEAIKEKRAIRFFFFQLSLDGSAQWWGLIGIGNGNNPFPGRSSWIIKLKRDTWLTGGN